MTHNHQARIAALMAFSKPLTVLLRKDSTKDLAMDVLKASDLTTEEVDQMSNLSPATKNVFTEALEKMDHQTPLEVTADDCFLTLFSK